MRASASRTSSAIVFAQSSFSTRREECDMLNIRLILTVLGLAKAAAGTLYAYWVRRRALRGHSSSARPAFQQPLHLTICTLFAISLSIVPFTVSPSCISASRPIIAERRCESSGFPHDALQPSGDPSVPGELPYWAMVTNGLAV